MAEAPIVVQSALTSFIKDFIFSLVLLALGGVILMVPFIQEALWQSLGKAFEVVDRNGQMGLENHRDLLAARYIPLGLFVTALLIEISVFYRFRFNKMTMGKDTVTKKYGFPLRKETEIKYSNVRTVEVWRGWMDKILGIGDVAIAAGGSQGFDIEMNGVKDPDSVASVIKRRQAGSRSGKLSGTSDKYNYF